MAIEIVDFPMKKCDFPYTWDSLPEGNACFWMILGSYYMMRHTHLGLRTRFQISIIPAQHRAPPNETLV